MGRSGLELGLNHFKASLTPRIDDKKGHLKMYLLKSLMRVFEVQSMHLSVSNEMWLIWGLFRDEAVVRGLADLRITP